MFVGYAFGKVTNGCIITKMSPTVAIRSNLIHVASADSIIDVIVSNMSGVVLVIMLHLYL